MINYVEFQLGDRKAAGELTPLTFVTGTGKSFLINSIYRILANIGNKIPKLYYDNFLITITIKERKFTLQKNRNIYRQILEGGGKRIVFEHGVVKGTTINRISEPFELTIKNADILMPFVEVNEHVSILADEEIESVNKIVEEFRSAFSLKVVLLGPYLDPRSSYDLSKATATLRPDGRNLVGILSMLALRDPDAYDRLRGLFRKKGVKLAVGLSRKGLLAGYAYINGVRIPISRLPCSLKAALVVTTAVATKPDLLLVDNFDYCFNEQLADVLSRYIDEQISRGQIVAELHRSDIAELFKTQYKSVLSISL